MNSYSLNAGGAERVVRTLHQGLLASGTESRLLGILEEDQFVQEGSTLALNSVYSPRAILGIREYIKANVKPGDIVHAHLFPANLYVSLLNQLGLIPCSVVATEHSTSNGRRGRWLGKAIDSLLYRGLDKVFAISDGVAGALKRWLPSVTGRLVTVANGVALKFDTPLARTRADVPIVLSVGNLREAKNYETILRAVARLEGEAFEYWIAGEGEFRSSLESLVRALGLEARVRFMGYQRDIALIMPQASIFLMASRWEGFGLAAVEAMNASLPVVASNIPGLREVVASTPPCALLVDPESPEEISDALKALLDDHALRNRLGAAGFERSMAFGVDVMVNRYQEQYRALCSG